MVHVEVEDETASKAKEAFGEFGRCVVADGGIVVHFEFEMAVGCVRWEHGHVLEVHDAGHVFCAKAAGSLAPPGDLGDAFSIVEWGWYECDFVRFVIRHRTGMCRAS